MCTVFSYTISLVERAAIKHAFITYVLHDHVFPTKSFQRVNCLLISFKSCELGVVKRTAKSLNENRFMFTKN